VPLFCSDGYGIYPLVLAVGNHHQGKGGTVALERSNGQQRIGLRLCGSAPSLSPKSLAMPLAHPKDTLPARQQRLTAAKGIERRVALFAHLHVNREATPKMYRLPIRNGQLFIIGQNALLVCESLFFFPWLILELEFMRTQWHEGHCATPRPWPQRGQARDRH
jgi:hypothetical protein